jgi:hypothetical protein
MRSDSATEVEIVRVGVMSRIERINPAWRRASSKREGKETKAFCSSARVDLEPPTDYPLIPPHPSKF